MKQYKIAYAGLKPGIHEYEYLIEDKFFEALEYSPYKKGEVKVLLKLNKQDALIILDFALKGHIQVPCDRCLELYFQEIESENRIIVKFGSEAYEESEEILVLSREDAELDVSHYIYEFIYLAI